MSVTPRSINSRPASTRPFDVDPLDRETYPTLYHIDSKGKTRVWWITRQGREYRTHAGIEGGQIVVSAPTVAQPKNVGRANATTAVAQAKAEIQSAYEHKTARKYSYARETASRHNFVAPMLALSWDAKVMKNRPAYYLWYAQPKLDGIRSLFGRHGNSSREGKPFSTVAHIESEPNLIRVLARHNAVFDGELYNHEYKDDFDSLVSLIKTQRIDRLTAEAMANIRAKVQFHVYDVFFPENPDMLYLDRARWLRAMFKNLKFRTLRYVPTIPIQAASIPNVHGRFIQNGYEGLMIRDPRMPYETKRSKGLYKFKDMQTDEFEILDILPGTGNWAGFAKVAIVRLKNGKTCEATFSGSREKNAERLRNRRKYIGCMATVRFQNYTPDGKLRFPVVLTIHDGRRRTI